MNKINRKYYTYRATYTSRPIKEPKAWSKPIKKTFRFILIIAVPIIAIIYFIFYSPVFKIKNIEIEGINDPTMLEKINEDKGRNIFLVNLDAVKKSILSNNPDLTNIYVIKGIPDTLKIKSQERKKSLVWVIPSGNYVLDENGCVFIKVKELGDWNNTDIPIVKYPNAIVAISSGQKIVSSFFIEKIKTIKSDFTNKTGITITEISITDSYNQINVLTANGWTVKMNLQEDLDYQMTNLSAIVKAQKPITAYVDLRIPGLAYYK